MQEILALAIATVGFLPARALVRGPSRAPAGDRGQPGRRRKLFRAASLLLNSAGIIFAVLLIAGEHDLAESLANADIVTVAFFATMLLVFAVHLTALTIAPGWRSRPAAELAYYGWSGICGTGLGLAVALFIIDPRVFRIAFGVGGQARTVYGFAAFYGVSVIVLAGTVIAIIKSAFAKYQGASAG